MGLEHLEFGEWFHQPVQHLPVGLRTLKFHEDYDAPMPVWLQSRIQQTINNRPHD